MSYKKIYRESTSAIAGITLLPITLSNSDTKNIKNNNKSEVYCFGFIKQPHFSSIRFK